MICKKDVIVWFKELESYKRIDTMCTLLNMCLPFELRFLGTCLEELGRRDSQELRGIELRVNNPQDLAIDMIACQKGEPTDMKIRRKMALYLALIRACNRTCTTSTEIFRTLDVWGDRDFPNMNDMDTLKELLLVYTMAANHPVFSFEQHRRCIEVFERINSNKLLNDATTTTTETSQPSTQQQQQQVQQQVQMDMSTSPLPTVGSTGHLQHDLRQAMPPPSHQEMLQQHALHAMHTPGQHPQLLSCPTPIQVISQGTMPINFPQHHIADAISHMNLSNIIPADTNTILLHPSGAWPPRSFAPPPGPPSMEHPPQSSSPMLSQQSSPSSSRTTSPSRAPSTNIIQQGMQQQMRNVPQRLGGSSLKNVRRPSAETTPPPMAQMMGEIILPPPLNLKNMDEVVLNSDGTHLQTLIRNGITRGAHHTRLKSGAYISSQPLQSPVNQHYQTMAPGNYATGITYAMQNVTLADGSLGTMQMSMDGSMVGMNSNKSTGSDSGSSIGSSGEISPPETPTIMTNQSTNPGGHREQQQMKHHHQPQVIYKPMTMSRLNGGRGEKLHAGTSGSGGGAIVGVSSASTIIYAPATTLANTVHQQTQSQFGDIILAPGGNAGVVSNNSLGDIVSSSNNNMNAAGATVLISTSAPTITSNAAILQSHQQQTSAQQQYNATYPYHAAQHIATTTRPPPPLMPPPPPNAFRFPPSELIFSPPYHPGSITFLPATGTSAAVAPPPQVALRPVSTVAGVVTANATTSTQQLQQLQPQPGATILPISPYSALSLSGGTSTTMVPKPISCYNCGSQTHTGRDCPEASMDDVTRSAIYKLDYSVSAAATPVTNVATTTSTATGSGNISGTDNTATTAQQKQENLQHISTTTTSLASTVAAAAAVSSTK